MFRKRLAISAWGLCLALAAVARAGDGKTPSPARAAPPIREEPQQIKVHRLYHADAATLVKEFSAIVDSHRIRLVAYPTGNAVVVSGPPSAQEAMADLIARLDAASPASAGSARPTGEVGQARVPTRTTTAHAAETGKDARPAGSQEDVIKVIRVPNGDLSALARALSEVARARSSTAVRSVVVTPSGGEEPAQKASRPAETHQR